MEERFDLARWELAPDSPEKLEGVASGVVAANWMEEEWEFLLREVEVTKGLRVIFLRERASSDAGNWVFCDHATWCRPQNSWRLKHHLLRLNGKRCFFHNELHRTFHLNLLPGRVVTVKPTGEVAFQHSGPDRTLTRFRLNRSGLERESAASCLQLVQQELFTPHSRGQFALEWEGMNFEERADFLVQCQQGTYSQMRGLLRNVLVHAIQPDANFEESSWLCHINPRLYSSSTLWLRFPSQRQRRTRFEETSHLRQWRQALTSWFEPQLIKMMAPQHQSAWIWRDHVREGTICTVSTSIPTQHERLEAALELRDWARNKVPDELLRTLI